MIRTADDGERRFAYWRDQSAAREVLSRGDLSAHLDADLIHLSGITLQLMIAPVARGAAGGFFCVSDGPAARASASTPTTGREARRSPDEAADAITRACEAADIVLASREEVDLLYGEQTAEVGVRRLLDLGAHELILRDGPAGAYVGTENDVVHVPATQVRDVVDTTAAGDAFGSYRAARLAGERPEAAAALGNAVAGTVIQHPGAITLRSIRLVGPATAAPSSH